MLDVERRHRLLVFQDAVGISSGYMGIWKSLLERTGLGEKHTHVVLRSAYSNFSKGHLLEWQKKRKQPGFNTNVQKQMATRAWVKMVIEQHEPDMVACQDPALLFLLNNKWDQATLDRLRGGFYVAFDLPWIVTLPITAFHAKMDKKDIAKLNEGYTEKADFEEFRDDEESDAEDEDDGTMEWHEPVVTPYGKIVLEFDYQKVARIMARIPK